MDLQNLAYALTQVLHNFGAIGVVGGALFGLWLRDSQPESRRKLAWLVLLGWVLQGASGAGFGVVSYLYYRQLPDLHDVALAALLVKMACAVAGIVLSAGYLRYRHVWSVARQEVVWALLAIFGMTALTAAAFLRWFA